VRGSSGIAVGAAGLLVTGLAWWGAQDQSRPLDPHNRATALVPPDGYRSTGIDKDGTVFVQEEARLTGSTALSGAPPLVGGAVLSQFPDPGDLRIWRSVQTPVDADVDPDTGFTDQAVTLTQLTDRGLVELAAYGAFTLVFDPPLLEVPADVHDGQQWSSHGDAVPGGGVTYTGTTKATDAGHGCFRFTGRFVFASGTSTVSQPFDQKWCPGRGQLPYAPAAPTGWTGSTEPLATKAVTDDASGWTARPLPLVVAGSLTDLDGAGGPMAIALDLPPVALPGGAMAVVDARSGDVWGLTPASGSMVRAWIGHPGGDVTTIGSTGGATVVTTAHREALSYGEHGQWLWTARLPDVDLTTPLAVDADHVVLTTVLGDVLALDPHDGHRAWTGSMSDQVELTPVTDGDHVAATDIAGQLSLFDVDTGDTAWTVDLPAPADAIGIVGDSVVVVMGGTVGSFSLADGGRSWTAADDDTGPGTTVADVGGTVVVATDASTVGYDARTGRRRWSTSGATSSSALGDLLLQQTDGRLVARDGDGHVAGRWSVSNHVSESTYLVPNGTGAWAMDGIGDATVVGP